MLRRDTQFIYIVHCVMNCTVTFELEYDMQFLQARMSEISNDMKSSQLIQVASLSMGCCSARVAKLFLKNNKLLTFVTEQSKLNSGSHDLGLVHLYCAMSFLRVERMQGS